MTLLKTQNIQINENEDYDQYFRTWRLDVSGYGCVPGDPGSPDTVPNLETLPKNKGKSMVAYFCHEIAR